MAKFKSNLSSCEIKGYINKLYDEIVEEMDSFLSDRQHKPQAKPFNHVFSRLEKKNHGFSKNKLWGSDHPLRDKYFSFDKMHHKPNPSPFLSSFKNNQALQGFSSRHYFAQNKEKEPAQSSFEQTHAKKVSSFFEFSPWQQDLSHSSKSTKIPFESAEENFHLFKQTTDSLIPSLKASLGLFSATKKEKMSLESACKKTPDISSKKPLKNETLLAEEELNDLLSPMAGMIERKEDKLSLNKDNSLFKNDLEDKKTEKEAIEAKNNRHDNLWQYLEQEGSLKDLFAHVKLSSCEAEPVKTLADDLKPRTQEAGSPSDEWSDDPFFATLEKTLDPNANSLASFEANKQENDFNSLDVERSTKELSEPLNESHSGLNWAGELRWHVLARKDLSRFKALLPEGFVMCDGESSLDNGAFHVSSTAVKGKLPKWLEEVDEKHVVVGILKVSAS